MTTVVSPTPTMDRIATPDPALQRAELAAFLRTRRERITPEQVGLASTGRRRTPGLRREEVANLAGVGVTWYTWLEQGREINVSEQVLTAISRVLLLDPHEETHLFTLAGAALPSARAECQGIPSDVPVLLDKLHPFPASVTNARFDLLAYNRAYQCLVGDLDSLPFDQRNSLWLIFTSVAFRTMILDWEEGSRRMVGQYRAAMADHVGEPTWKCLVRRLQEASPEFADLWQRHEVNKPENVTKRMLHPDVGFLQLRFTNLWLAPQIGLRMICYVPADEQTNEAVERLEDVVPRALP